MSDKHDPLLIAWWAKNLEETDREIARLALLCEVKILEPGVIERILRRDASVCGVENPAAFSKLHDMVVLHVAVNMRSIDALGPALTAQIEAAIIERLRKPYAALVGELPAG